MCIDIYRHIIRYIQVICIYIHTCSYTYVYRYIVMLYTHMIIYDTGLQPHPPSHGHGPIPGPSPRPPCGNGGVSGMYLMSCTVMLCYVMLCNVMHGYVMLCMVM